jgi:hypothetical protein
MDIKEFGLKFIEAENRAFRQGNFEALDSIQAPDIVIHWGGGRDMVGREAHKQDIINYRQRTSKHIQAWDYVTGDGDVCVLSIRETMTFAEEFPAISAPAGATIEFDAFFVLRRENNKVVEAWIKGASRVLNQR